MDSRCRFAKGPAQICDNPICKEDYQYEVCPVSRGMHYCGLWEERQDVTGCQTN
jgi:hypothetical protein